MLHRFFEWDIVPKCTRTIMMSETTNISEDPSVLSGNDNVKVVSMKMRSTDHHQKQLLHRFSKWDIVQKCTETYMVT